ncbi:MAG: transcriptional repressor [Deltaproteobacteria bacterium]|nr:transcriptional repressor [Deltaproteobacteria bacterium]
MKISPEELKQRMNRFKEGLKRSGIKLTHQRLEIFREVAESGDHPDAETIYRGVRERIPTVSLDTVYRTLWLLLDLGLIATLGPSRERSRFDANMSPHHHFVCSRCGMTYDFCSPEFDQLNIPDSVMELGNVEKLQVEVRGICLQCSKK